MFFLVVLRTIFASEFEKVMLCRYVICDLLVFFFFLRVCNSTRVFFFVFLRTYLLRSLRLCSVFLAVLLLVQGYIVIPFFLLHICV